MIKAVTLDLWGTLFDMTPALSDVRLELLASRVPMRSRSDLLRAYDRGWEAFLAGLAYGYGLTASTFLATVLDDLAVSLTPPQFKRLLVSWQESIVSSPPPLLEGVADVLAILRKQGFFVGLVSDTAISPGWAVRRALADMGLLSMFDWLTFSDEVGVTKRRAAGFLLTLNAFGVCPEEGVHVGDMCDTDIRGAKAVGMKAILVLENTHDRSGASEADAVIDQIADLPAALSEITGSPG